jgi:hypothetical protein
MGNDKDRFNKYLENTHHENRTNWSGPEHMHVQALRIYSFVAWEGQPSATRLASAGYYFDAGKGKVICFSCRGIFHEWNRELTVIEQHRMENSNCAFAKGLDSRNIHLEPIENVTTSRVQNNASHNKENNSFVHKVQVSLPYAKRPKRTRHSSLGTSLDYIGSQHAPTADATLLYPVHADPGIVKPDHTVVPREVFCFRPRYPKYEDLQARIITYATMSWPPREQTPKQMAAAGFFYTGISDCVRCFACNGGLRNWLPGDDPWCEHKRWFPRCAFILTRENRPNHEQTRPASMDVPMLAIKDFQDNSLNPNPSSGNVSRGPLMDMEQELKRVGYTIDQFMISSVATIVVDMGFSEELIREVAQNLYVRSGKLYTRSTDLLEDIFHYDDQREKSATVGASSPAPAVSLQEQRQTTFASVLRPNPEPSDSDILPAKKPTKSGTVKNRQSRSNEVTLVDLESVYKELQTVRISNEDLIEATRCRVCFDKKKCIVFLPCGHLCTCSDCAAAVKKCPICRIYIRGTIKIRH